MDLREAFAAIALFGLLPGFSGPVESASETAASSTSHTPSPAPSSISAAHPYPDVLPGGPCVALEGLLQVYDRRQAGAR